MRNKSTGMIRKNKVVPAHYKYMNKININFIARVYLCKKSVLQSFL